MKSLKIILAIILLIGIGFLGGFFTHRYVAVQRIHRVAELRLAPGFEHHLFEIIEADEAQREQLRPIVEKYAEQIAEEHRELRQHRRLLIDALHEEIRPFLTTEQAERLDRFSRHFIEHPPHQRHPKKRPRREKKPG